MSREVSLEEIAQEEFVARHDFWGDDRLFREGHGYYSINEPLIGNSVPDLLAKAEGLKFLFKVSVRDGSYWKRFIQRDVERQSVREEIAFLASRDSRKRNYLEIELRKKGRSYESSAVIECTERRGLIVGYKVRVPWQAYDLVQFPNTPDSYSKVNALADPSCLARPRAARAETPAQPAGPYSLHTA